MVINQLTAAYEPDLYNPDCPTRVVLDRIGDRWTALVVLLLAERSPRRFTELRQGVGGIAPKVLTQTLRAMERDGLVKRTVYAEVPPRVEYELTPLGDSLRRPIAAIGRWAERHVAEVLEARKRFDEAQSGD
ncbi:putative transcriptional regulator [Longimycelium tulufanense]|uniref:Putative transcriptional regulator n=1 Tax=Longimycelium tulufanense TaxID=907463 RepID=A0A8J3CJ54_9PSEU|nr:helix-turn-helix domain-containing protein [Longimycelium tulufanense]GGM74497.1 putative transcriptional regulator [Longimycelium tulufanense]